MLGEHGVLEFDLRTGKRTRSSFIGKAILDSMAETKKYTYNDFWEMRGQQSIWFTRNISYRMGAVVALCASRIGVAPNMISLLSGAITIFSAMLAVYVGQGSWVAGVVLTLGLQIGYAFDCADGPLARATGQGSSFGSLLDKITDLSSGMLLPCILAYGIVISHLELPGGWCDFHLGILTLFLALRATLSVLMWMKELVIYNADRLIEDTRRRNLWWNLKKTVSLYIDEPVYRLGIALAWCLGLFWEFIVIYGFGVFMITVLYIVSSQKEMNAMDRASQRGVLKP
jgi:phosphatidylglycerophosphate synthase